MDYTSYDFALDIFDSMRGFIAMDTEGKIVFIQKTYANKLGLPQEEIIGKPMSEVFANGTLAPIIEQQKSEYGQYVRIKSAVTGQYMAGPSIANKILIRRHGDGEIVGAMAFTSVYRTQDPDTLRAEIEYLRKKHELFEQQLAGLYPANDALDRIMGNSEQTQEMKRLIQKVAETSVSVCVFGETGTGKELVANAIHKLSNRVGKPFIKINCAAIPKDLMESELFGYEPGAFTGAARQGKLGMFEMASGGTLLLDEIGELPLSLQAKLLRVLQENKLQRVGGVKTIPIDVRLVCSTNRNLKEMVDAGQFRADLYYRINVMEITVSPLRDRPEDISLLAVHFIHESNKRNGLAVSGMGDGVIELLTAHDWPGNIRELEHCIERACVLCGAGYLHPRHFNFPKDVSRLSSKETSEKSESVSFFNKREQAEVEGILKALEICGENRQKSAEMLGISRTTLFRKMKKYHLLDEE